MDDDSEMMENERKKKEPERNDWQSLIKLEGDLAVSRMREREVIRTR